MLNKLIGLLPSVTINPYKPNPPNNSAYYSGPLYAIETKVYYPIAFTIASNFFDSISPNSLAFLISSSVID